MRGRIANVASLWSGSPLLSIVIVTSAALHCVLFPATAFCGVPPTLHPGTAPTLSTLPTLMPAIRTSESGSRPLALAKTAWTVYWLANGLANLVKPR